MAASRRWALSSLTMQWQLSLFIRLSSIYRKYEKFYIKAWWIDGLGGKGIIKLTVQPNRNCVLEFFDKKILHFIYKK